MEFSLLGWPEDGPTLRLDYRRFSYAGKFVMSNTGKAVVRVAGRDPPELEQTDRPVPDPDAFDDSVVAAAAFNEDRTDPGVLWIRYVTVSSERRGEGIGPRLVAFVVAHAERRGYRRLRIAVNNPFAYHAMYKVGFVYTGRETGMAELVLERPGQRDQASYQCGLDVFRERDRGDPEASFLRAREGEAPPELLAPDDCEAFDVAEAPGHEATDVAAGAPGPASGDDESTDSGA
ncbi:MAG: GNAT family N-acetyltransferase [Haloferacaceae archaeon]